MLKVPQRLRCLGDHVNKPCNFLLSGDALSGQGSKDLGCLGVNSNCALQVLTCQVP